MVKKILITGGSGFIGTNFIKHIYNLYSDLEIFNLDYLDFKISYHNHDELSSERYNLLEGSLLDKNFLEKIFKEYNFDQVINFAAKSHVDNSIINPGIFTTNNILGTQNLLDCSLKNNIGLFIQISTDEVYGSLNEFEDSTTEMSNLLPNNPYSASKAGADCIVRSYFQTFQLPCIITRSSNNFGPYQYPEKLIPVIIGKALNNSEIPIYGDGQNIRDWIYVSENCKAIDFIRNKGKVGEIYNIPGHKEIKNIDLCKSILNILNKPYNLIKFIDDRKGHDFRYSMNGTKLEKLGFKLTSEFEDNLEKTIEWYINHKPWLALKEITNV